MHTKEIHDIATGEITQVQLAGDELAEYVKAIEDAEASAARAEAEAAEKAAAKERIAQTLGLTLDELKVLLS